MRWARVAWASAEFVRAHDLLDQFLSSVRRAAAWDLEVRVTGTPEWQPVARVVLEQRLPITDEESWFSPFTADRGFAPDGFLGGLRSVAYRLARPVRGG